MSENNTVVLKYTELEDLTIPGKNDAGEDIAVEIPTGVSVAGYAWSKKDNCFIKTDKDVEGPDKLVLSAPKAIVDKNAKPPTMTVAEIKAAEAEGKCLPGHVKNGDGKCVPIKEALDERDAKILELASSVLTLTTAARTAKIEKTVDEQIAAGHVMPVQRVKAINFMAALPDDQHGDLLGVFGLQKFTLGDGAVQDGNNKDGETAVKIAETETIEGLSDDDRADLRKRFGMDELIKTRGAI